MYFEFHLPERRAATWSPNIDVCEGPSEIVIFVEMPGVNRSDVQISWNNGTLVISGQKRRQEPEYGRSNYLCVERSYGLFRREIEISVAIDHKNAKAELRDGLMRIRLPKVAAKPESGTIPIL